MTPVDVVLRFVDAINAKDLQGIAALMTDDHRFVDSLGTTVAGAEKMREGWEAYLRLVPDFRVEVRETYCNGQVVVLLGAARGTYTSDGTLRPENVWETPGAWRALVRGSRVAEWQVYADNEPIRRRMTAHFGQQGDAADRPSTGR
ncbi:MAG: nuclear transport factor 2 family protein [Gammaproteobacteria bacterium]|nr:nuclear transport factor 2 family protein [Gammaproteobacteria bacterium]